VRFRTICFMISSLLLLLIPRWYQRRGKEVLQPVARVTTFG
jgi:hypothetical protein